MIAEDRENGTLSAAAAHARGEERDLIELLKSL
jgi:hypothetical protein